jgi:TetR/AcrR family transcriptional regulator, cholesterol catabolism regulator
LGRQVVVAVAPSGAEHARDETAEAAAGARALPQGAPVTSPAQQERRERILTVALGLASHKGYDAVLMRDVAEQAGVALGTLYRYFPSKEQLFAAALTRWLHHMRQQVRTRPPTAHDPAARVIAVMNELVDQMDRNHQLAGAYIHAMASTPNGAGLDIAEDAMTRLVGAAAFGPDHVVDQQDKLVTEIIGKVFLMDLCYWQGQVRTLEHVRTSMVDTVRLVLAGRLAATREPAVQDD